MSDEVTFSRRFRELVVLSDGEVALLALGIVLDGELEDARDTDYVMRSSLKSYLAYGEKVPFLIGAAVEFIESLREEIVAEERSEKK